MDEKLEAFLAGKSGQGIETGQQIAAQDLDNTFSANAAAVEAPAPAPEPEPTPDPEPPAATAPAPAGDDDDDDDGAPVPSGGTIPVHVLQAERNKRRDYKAQVIRQEEQLKAAQEQSKLLLAQLEEMRKAPPVAPAAPPPPAPVPAPAQQVAIPNPIEDPEGYHRWLVDQQQFSNFVNLLNTTEVILRDKEGDEAVDKAIESFKGLITAEEQTFGAGKSPLQQAFKVQLNPYRWMYNQVKKAEADKEIGGDLAGFKARTEAGMRERLEAELRAKFEAEFAEKAAAAAAAAPPPIQIAAMPVKAPPNVVLPKSLANAPSAAPRSAPAWTGPTALSDIVARR